MLFMDRCFPNDAMLENIFPTFCVFREKENEVISRSGYITPLNFPILLRLLLFVIGASFVCFKLFALSTKKQFESDQLASYSF